MKSDDGNINLKMSLPQDHKPDTTNPEQLFAAGFSACFLSALKHIQPQVVDRKLPDDTSVTGVVDLGPSKDKKGFQIGAELKVKIPGFSAEEVQKLTEAAERACPYSNATRGNIDVKITPLI